VGPREKGQTAAAIRAAELLGKVVIHGMVINDRCTLQVLCEGRLLDGTVITDKQLAQSKLGLEQTGKLQPTSGRSATWPISIGTGGRLQSEEVGNINRNARPTLPESAVGHLNWLTIGKLRAAIFCSSHCGQQANL
jgi:hypothetical protein